MPGWTEVNSINQSIKDEVNSESYARSVFTKSENQFVWGSIRENEMVRRSIILYKVQLN